MYTALFLLPFIFGVALASEEEVALYKALFRNYGAAERAARGVEHYSNQLNTTFALTIIGIVDMDTDKGYATLSTWTPMAWTDNRLRWNPDNYGGLKSLKLPNNIIWKPDTMLYNRISANVEDIDSMLVVSSDGSVLYVPPVIIEAPCQKEPTANIWSCYLKFGSWVYDGFQLDINFQGENRPNLDFFAVRDNGWRIVAQEGARSVKYYPCCTEPYTDITFRFQITK